MTLNMSLQSSGKIGLHVVQQAENVNSSALTDSSQCFSQLSEYVNVECNM